MVIVIIVISRRRSKLKIDLYTIHCPQCMVLEKKLEQKNINYFEHDDIDEIRNMGFMAVPVLVVDGKKMPFGEAIQWINSLEE